MVRQMKDSGIEWIGEIPETWTISKNKYLLDSMYSGGTPSASNSEFYAEAEGTPFVSISDMSVTDYVLTTKKSLTPAGIADKGLLVLPAGTVLYSIYATVGAVSELAIDATISQAMLALTVKQDVDKQYYKYCLFAMKDYTFGSANGNTQFNLNAEKVWNFVFPKPCTPEQHRIAAFLDRKCAEIDAVIERTKATIEEYKKLKQAVITEAVTKGVRGPRPMKDSRIEYLGEHPCEWSISTISMLFTFLGGFAFKSELFCEETNNQVIRIGNIRDDVLLIDSKAVYIDDEYAEATNESMLKADDILFSMTGTKGKKDYFYTVLVMPQHLAHKRLFLNQRVGCFRAKQKLNMKYYSYLLKVNRIKEYIFLFETGTANQGNLGIETIKRTKLFRPPYCEQEEIVAYLDEKCAALDTLIAKKTALLTELETYKKSLIYEYVTGKKEV